MARASISRKKKKVTISNARKSIMVEEKHVGRETTDWKNILPEDMEKKVYETLRHYGYFYDVKDSYKWAIEWVKINRTKQDLKNFKAAPERHFSSTVSGLCKMLMNGAVFNEKRMGFINKNVNEQIQRGINKAEEATEEKIVDIRKKSPAEIVKERTSDFIAEIEEVIDMFGGKAHVDWDEYSVYNELQRIDAPYNTAKAVVDYYTPLRDEIQELVEEKTDDLVEVYTWLGPRKRKQYLKVIQSIIDDAEKYMMSKKAVRKTRKKKDTPASKQVEKMKYMANSAEYKLVSVDPINIVGASEVYLFNTKYRTMTYLVTQSPKGFEVKGTTIQGIDVEASYKKTLRKPEEFFSEFTKTTKAKARKLLKDLKTKEASCNGRVNDQTIIVKVYT